MTAAADSAASARRIGDAVTRALAGRLVVDEPIALLTHIVLILITASTLWGEAPRGLLGAWVGTVFVAVGLRRLVLLRLARPGVPSDAVPRAVRLSVATLGLTWGIGAAAVFPTVSVAHEAVTMVVLAGLVAGATATLVADPPSFMLFVLLILGPLPLGILAGGFGRTEWTLVLLTAVYAAMMLVVHRRAHVALLTYLGTSARLEIEEELSERERAHLDALLTSAPVAVVVLDRNGRVRRVNPRFTALFGHGPEVVGQDLNELIVPESEIAAARRIDERALGGERVVAEVQRRSRDGSVIPVRASAALVPGAEDSVFVMYEDVSDEAAARAAMQEARAAAERAARARSQFLANMSHEIRTPLNAVLGLTELLLDSGLTPEQRRSLALVRSSGEALLSLLNDVLDFSKIDAEHLELEDIPFDPRHVVESTTALLSVRARAGRIELLADVAADVPHTVRGDPTRLRQVLTNLVGNALKFTERGEVVVSAARSGERDGRALVTFAVRDTGIGIPEQQLGAIFEEFTQADASMTRRYGGTGLGLAIARRLVAAMSGELTVTSVVGQGSEFSFTVPFVVVATESGDMPRSVVLAGRRVLIVDDNATNRRILRDMLASAGVDVVEAAGADAGLATLRAGPPFDIAITDAQMPGRDGFDFAAAVRADAALAGVRLLMLTSAGQPGDGQRCRDLGIHGYFTKPIPRAELLEALAAVLQGDGASAGAPMLTRHAIAEARRRVRILLAEDNAVNQEVAATMLRRRGHHVDVVGNGRAAVDAVRHGTYDVVLMDVQMPDLDGFAATLEIRSLPGGANLPIVALTAHALSGERERCLAQGMTAYLAKPFHPDALFAAVEGSTPGVPPAPAVPASPSPASVDLAGFRRELEDANAGEAVAGILATFVAGVPERLEALSAAAAARNAAAMQRAAHAFKGAAGAIHAAPLAQLLHDVEAAARAGDLPAATRGVPLVAAEAQRVLAVLAAAG